MDFIKNFETFRIYSLIEVFQQIALRPEIVKSTEMCQFSSNYHSRSKANTLRRGDYGSPLLTKGLNDQPKTLRTRSLHDVPV